MKLFQLAIGVMAAAALSACQGGDEGGGNVDQDWVQNPTPTPTPTVTTPAPKITPSPTPTATPSPTPTPTAGQLYIGPAEVEKYVVKFVNDASIQGVDVVPNMSNPKLEIRIASLDSVGASVIGLCETGSNLRRLTLDPDFWTPSSETQRELLAHHELGHCVLMRGHRTETLSNGAYASIMGPIIMSSATYTASYDYYQQELFTWAANALITDPGQPNSHICHEEDLGKPEAAHE